MSAKTNREVGFLSGPWVGFTNLGDGSPRRMLAVELHFLEGRVRGSGTDDRGSFSIYGTYEADSMECALTQVRDAAADVHFTGYREPRTIWGTWTSPPDGHGGFQVWPRDQAPDDLLEEFSIRAR